MPEFQSVRLKYFVDRKCLRLELPEEPKRINAGLKAMFSPYKLEINGLSNVRAALAHIREVPSYQKLIETLTVEKQQKQSAPHVSMTTVSNLEVYVVFQQALRVTNVQKLVARSLRRLVGLETHLLAVQQSLLVAHEVDTAHFIGQVKNLIGFLPKFCHNLFGVFALDEAISQLHRKRIWQSQRKIPKSFAEQFPTVVAKAKSKQSTQDGGDGAGGHNMLNPKRTQEPKPKDDMTPLKTRPGKQ